MHVQQIQCISKVLDLLHGAEQLCSLLHIFVPGKSQTRNITTSLGAEAVSFTRCLVVKENALKLVMVYK